MYVDDMYCCCCWLVSDLAGAMLPNDSWAGTGTGDVCVEMGVIAVMHRHSTVIQRLASPQSYRPLPPGGM